MPVLTARRLAHAVIAVLAGAAVSAVPVMAQTSDLVSTSELRVCADPANAPASDMSLSGYENKIAALIGDALDRPVGYTWYPMATGFIRNTLRANRCDVVIGYAQGHEMVLNTNHYLTSAYVLIVPDGSDIADVDRLSDDRLKGKRIGVIAGGPPGDHLARNGLIGKARPYHLFVDRRHAAPPVDMLDESDVREFAIEVQQCREPPVDRVVPHKFQRHNARVAKQRVLVAIRNQVVLKKREKNALQRRSEMLKGSSGQVVCNQPRDHRVADRDEIAAR